MGTLGTENPCLHHLSRGDVTIATGIGLANEARARAATVGVNVCSQTHDLALRLAIILTVLKVQAHHLVVIARRPLLVNAHYPLVDSPILHPAEGDIAPIVTRVEGQILDHLRQSARDVPSGTLRPEATVPLLPVDLGMPVLFRPVDGHHLVMTHVHLLVRPPTGGEIPSHLRHPVDGQNRLYQQVPPCQSAIGAGAGIEVRLNTS